MSATLRGKPRGRPEQAQGILIAALDVLAGHDDRTEPGPGVDAADRPEPTGRQAM